MHAFWLRLRQRLRSLFSRRRLEAEMEEEMRFHLEQRAAEQAERGVTTAEAQRLARHRFGPLNRIQEEAREATHGAVWEQVRWDLRCAWRGLHRNPLFTAAGMGTLSLCLAANLVLFALIHSVLLSPLPFPDADRLVTSYNSYVRAGVADDGSSVANYYDYRGAIPGLSSLALFQEQRAILGRAGQAERQSVAFITPEFFATLRVPLAHGRTFTEHELDPGAPSVAIVTAEFAARHLTQQAQGDYLDAPLILDDREYRVVGVVPSGFRFLSSSASVFLPLVSHGVQRGPGARHWGGGTRRFIGRLAEGASPAVVESQLQARYLAVAAGDRDFNAMAEAGFRSPVQRLKDFHVAPMRTPLLLLQGAVLLLLAIGMVNLLNLLLIKASAREKEISLRSALGASRRHVIRAALAETLLLSLGGGAGGTIGAWWILAALQEGHLLPPAAAELLVLDARLLGVAFGLAVVIAIVLALPVAFFGLKVQLASALAGESRTATATRSTQRLRHTFVIAQVALSFLLLAGAGLLASGLHRTLAQSPGFDPRGTLTAELTLSQALYPDSLARAALARALAERSGPAQELILGVGTNLPFSRHNGKSSAAVVGYERPAHVPPRAKHAVGVGGHYFEALGIPLLRGRYLTDEDSWRQTRPCVVDAAFAQFYWGEADPLGKRLFQGGEIGGRSLDESFEVVGVVATVKQSQLTESDPIGTVYYPLAHLSDSRLYVAARTPTGRSPEAGALRHYVQTVASGIPLSDATSMEARIEGSTALRRSSTTLTAGFAMIALVLSALGVFGVANFSLQQRRREIAVRLALGAEPAWIERWFLGAGGRLLAAGLGLGLVAALSLKVLLDRLLPSVPSYDFTVLAATAGILAAILLLAIWIPARQAARVDPNFELKRG